MSDGPHRSLIMSKAWKRLAERADIKAFDPAEVCAAVPTALAEDWRDLAREILTVVREVLDPSRPHLFSDEAVARLDNCRPLCAGSPIATQLIDCAKAALNAGAITDDTHNGVISEALQGATVQRFRQIEEHYHRKAGGLRAGELRGRLSAAGMQVDYSALASTLTQGGARATRPPPKQSGLDDGVRF